VPELPEVENVRRSLLPHVRGKTIARVTVRHPKIIRLDPQLPRRLKGKKIAGIDRVGKLLIFRFAADDRVLLIHLKMTGQLIFAGGKKAGGRAEAGLPDEARKAKAGGGHSLTEIDLQLPHDRTRIIVEFTDDSALYFNDLRLFATMRTASAEELSIIVSTYGIEPMQRNFTREAFENIFRNRNTNVKALLLNQTLIAGLGNIYVDEVCHYAGVRPSRNARRLTLAEKRKLFDGCRKIIGDAIDAGGTTFHSFLHGDGREGGYLPRLRVFGRQGQPCPRCKTVIRKTKVAGRGTHFCPGCQK
jgi:formamidopyrimidine-DNA glycosylase